MTKLSAACTDSFITSPSLPVAVTLPLPGSVTASMVSSSPPTSVQASPVVTPDQILALGLAEAELPHPGIFLEVAARDRDPLGLLHQDVLDRLAGQVGDLALQIADAGLARVVADQVAERVVADAPLALLQRRAPCICFGIRWRLAISTFSSSV